MSRAGGTAGPALVGLWSVPRARSTAFLRMMTERGDYLVVHEPFSRVTDFGEVSVGPTRCHTPEEVKLALTSLAEEQPVFFKDTMDFRYPSVIEDTDFLRAARHAFMVRRTEAVVSSHLRVDPHARLEAMGFEYLAELFDAVAAATGAQPWVVDGDDLVAAPGEVVRAFCDHVGIAYYPEALEWAEGSLPAWQQATRGWHEDVARTTGFVATTPAPLPAPLQAVAEAYAGYHRPYYERLRRVVVRAAAGTS